MGRITLALAAAATLSAPASAAGQDLEVSFEAGLVTLVARDVPVADILDEWSFVGETTFVDAEEMPWETVSLELYDVPEDEALRILLREAAGYIAAPRPTISDQLSRFERVLVMARSENAARAGSYTPPPPAASQRAPRVISPVSGADTIDENEALEALRELLPSPAEARRRARGRPASPTPAATAPRPGMPVESEEEEAAPVFIRPVEPQADDR